MPTLIKNGKNYSGTSVSLTQAEYDALTETQKNDGTVYFITDSDAVLDASDVAVGSGTVEDSIGSISVIETSPATSAHAVGTYLVYNGKLYKVTSAIAVGETLTVGTNISATTVMGESGTWEVKKTSSITGGAFTLYVNRYQKLGAIRWQGDSTSLQAGTYSFTYGELITAVFTTLLPIHPASAEGYLEVGSSTARLCLNTASSWSSCTVVFPISAINY